MESNPRSSESQRICTAISKSLGNWLSLTTGTDTSVIAMSGLKIQLTPHITIAFRVNLAYLMIYLLIYGERI